MKKIFALICGLVLSVSTFANTSNEITTIVVPVAPGGATDIIARHLAQALTESGTPSIVLNKPGAERIIGSTYAVEQPADGKTLFLGAISDTVLLPLYKPSGSKITESSFIPVAMLASTPAVLTASRDVPANNYKEFQSLIKNKPDQYPIGSFGKLSSLLAHSIFNSVKTKPTIVLYKSDPQLSTDLIAGNLKLGIQTLPAAKEFIKDNRIKLVSTLDQQFWFGVFVPAGTDPGVVKRLNQQINSVMDTTSMKEKLDSLDYRRISMSQEQFVGYYHQQLKFFRPLVDAEKVQEK